MLCAPSDPKPSSLLDISSQRAHQHLGLLAANTGSFSPLLNGSLSHMVAPLKPFRGNRGCQQSPPVLLYCSHYPYSFPNENRHCFPSQTLVSSAQPLQKPPPAVDSHSATTVTFLNCTETGVKQRQRVLCSLERASFAST